MIDEMFVFVCVLMSVLILRDGCLFRVVSPDRVFHSLIYDITLNKNKSHKLQKTNKACIDSTSILAPYIASR